ncbi:iron ABC transporter permease [bacterium]|nr:iron ABC transporter permease [bacterium]
MRRDASSFMLLLLSAMLLALVAISLTAGSVTIPLRDLWSILQGTPSSDPVFQTIVWEVRLPRMLVALLAGAALSAAGLAMQTLFRNPLAGPYVLGVDAGASLGVALVTLSVGAGKESFLATVGLWSGMGRLLAATIGAAGALGVVMLVAARVGSDLTILIVGLLMSYFVSGLIGFLIYQAEPESSQRYLLWTFGSFDNIPWPSLFLLAGAVLVGISLIFLLVKGMDALLLGEESAESLGIAVRSTRWGLVVGSSLLAAAVTATCGPIGFIGVAVPHLSRWVMRSSIHRILMPATILLGAMVALIADLIARGSAGNTPMPINVVTSLFGAPLLLVLVLNRREARW